MVQAMFHAMALQGHDHAYLVKIYTQIMEGQQSANDLSSIFSPYIMPVLYIVYSST